MFVRDDGADYLRRRGGREGREERGERGFVG
jgi:hypothetical protein